MNCPNCGRPVSDGQSYCNSCGGVLYGPRNINLNNPGKAAGSEQSNDISSITGIDINSLTKDIGLDNNQFNEEPVEPVKQKKSKKEKKERKHSSKGLGSSIIFIIVIAVLLITCIILFLANYNLRKNNENPKEESKKCKKCENSIATCAEGIYGIAGYYAFQAPSDYRFGEILGGSAIKSETTSIIIFDYINDDISVLNEESVVKAYSDQGKTSVNYETTTLNEKQIIFVSYIAKSSDGVVYYISDYYMQYDKETVIYGQIISTQTDVHGESDVTGILSSIIPLDEPNKIQVSKSKFNYSAILPNAPSSESNKNETI